MKQTVFSMMILCAVIAGCSQQNPAKESSGQFSLQACLPGVPSQIAWKVPSSTWPDLCTKIEIEIQDANKMATMVSADTTVLLSLIGPSFYSDSTCSNSTLVASLVISQNTSSKIIYLKSSTLGIAKMNAVAIGLVSAFLNFNTFAPLADLILGQVDFTTSAANIGGINATTDGTKAYVADQLKNRILIWNSKNPVLGSNADLVLGQPDFTSSTSNNGGISASSLGSVDSISSDGTRLFAVDALNHRIHIWNSIPTSNFRVADVVIGQPDMTSNQSNNGGLGAATLSSPKSVFSDGQKLVVADAGNNRVLIWNSIPSSNFQAADVVIGQSNFLSNLSGTSAATFDHPRGLDLHDNELWIGDQGNNRVLRMTIPF